MSKKRIVRRVEPLKKVSAEERYALVAKIDRHRRYFPTQKLDSICHDLNVPPSNYRRWKAILDAHPEYHALKMIPERSKRPHRLARQVSKTTQQQVIAEAHQPHHTSANSIKKQLNEDGVVIGTAKVIKILEEAGLYGTIYRQNAQGDYIKKRCLLRCCEKPLKGP